MTSPLVPSSVDAATAARPAPRAVQRARAAVIGCTALLVLLGLAWELALAPTGRGTLAIKVLPLALLLPGLARHRLYSYRVASLVVWLYVTEGLVRSTSEGGLSRWLAAAEVVLATALFVAVLHYIRLRLPRAAKVASTPAHAAVRPPQ